MIPYIVRRKIELAVSRRFDCPWRVTQHYASLCSSKDLAPAETVVSTG
jgi:hypothetical protein